MLTAKYNPNPPSAISLAVNNIPNLHFLAKIPSDAVLQSFPADRYPRHGVTTFTHNGEDYCLDPSGISAGERYQQVLQCCVLPYLHVVTFV